MRSRWLTALLMLQCLRTATACSSHSQHSSASATASGDSQSLLQWDEPQPQHQRRRLRQSGTPTAGIKVKHIKRRDCGAEKPSSETQQSVQRVISPHVAQIQQMAANNRVAAAPTVVGVYFHILRAAAGDPNQGDVATSAIEKQVAVMNKSYAPAGFQFQLLGISRTTNKAWFNADVFNTDGSNTIGKLKDALHQGNVSTLNIYTLNLSDDLLGISNYPWSIGPDPKQDSVVSHFSALPGQGYAGYNLGMTIVHESGHWLGLYHPFQGGCTLPNDDVTDTGMMSGPNYNCVAFNKKVSTCPAKARGPGDPGYDASNNYMGYAPDACMNVFTQDQATRMQASWSAYRKAGTAKKSVSAPTPKPTAKKPTKMTVRESTPIRAPTKAPTKVPTRKAGR